MPIYEYECGECGHRSEAIQRLAEEPLTECGECGGAVRRLISAPAVQFKGTGWYVTDYGGRKGEKESSESKSTKEGAGKAGDGAAKADTSADKTGSKPSE